MTMTIKALESQCRKRMRPQKARGTGTIEICPGRGNNSARVGYYFETRTSLLVADAH
jgi:hypothetical protein